MHCYEMNLQQGGLPGDKIPKDHDWALFFRFLAISTVATLASIGNIFTISAIIIDDLLRKKGNAFLVSLTLADLLVTTIVLPASSVAILSQMESSENLCRFQYAVGATSCVLGAIFTAIVGVENFIRLRTLRQVEQHRRRRQSHNNHSTSSAAMATSSLTAATTQRALAVHMLPPEPQKPYRCSQFQVTIFNLSLWAISGFFVLVHVLAMPQLMYSACGFWNEPGLTRESLIQSLLIFSASFAALILVGGLGFLKCVCIMKAWDRPKPYLISREFALVTSNCWNWLVRFLIWCPSLIVAIVTHSQESSILSTGSHFSSSSTTDAIMKQSSSSSAALLSSSTLSPFLLLESGMAGPSNGLFSSIVSSSSNSSSRISASEIISLQRLLLWPAILPPCLSSLINALSNRDFRRCYIQLFHYCCCKTSVALTRRSRDNLRGGSDVRVHIIPGYNIYTSSTGHFSEVTTTPPRFNTFKCGSLISGSCRRDVYEL